MDDSTMEIYAPLFAMIPEWLLYSIEVSAIAIRVFAVLHRYADTSNSTLVAWPSRSTLAKRACCSIRTLDKAIGELMHVGALVVSERRADGGRQTSNLYTLTGFGGVVQSADSAQGGVQNLHRGGAEFDTLTRDSEREKEKLSSAIDNDFARVWAEYPRKIARAQALKAFSATIKAKRATTEQLLDATRNYALSRIGADPAFTLHGSTFYGPSARWVDFVDSPGELVNDQKSEIERERMREFQKQRDEEHAASVSMPASVKASLRKMRGNL